MTVRLTTRFPASSKYQQYDDIDRVVSDGVTLRLVRGAFPWVTGSRSVGYWLRDIAEIELVEEP